MEHLFIPRDWFIQKEDGSTLLLTNSLDSEMLQKQIAKANDIFTKVNLPKSLENINYSFQAGFAIDSQELWEMLKAIVHCRFADQLHNPSSIPEDFQALNAELLSQALSIEADHRVVMLECDFGDPWMYVPGWNDIQTRDWLMRVSHCGVNISICEYFDESIHSTPFFINIDIIDISIRRTLELRRIGETNYKDLISLVPNPAGGALSKPQRPGHSASSSTARRTVAKQNETIAEQEETDHRPKPNQADVMGDDDLINRSIRTHSEHLSNAPHLHSTNERFLNSCFVQ